MKTVRGTLVQRMIIKETETEVEAFCDECLEERKLKKRPGSPQVNDEFDIVVTDPDTSKFKRNTLSGVVRDGMLNGKVIGYRCNGCDRRIDLDAA